MKIGPTFNDCQHIDYALTSSLDLAKSRIQSASSGGMHVTPHQCWPLAQGFLNV